MVRLFFNTEHELARFVRAMGARVADASVWGKLPDQRYYIDLVDDSRMVWF